MEGTLLPVMCVCFPFPPLPSSGTLTRTRINRVNSPPGRSSSWMAKPSRYASIHPPFYPAPSFTLTFTLTQKRTDKWTHHAGRITSLALSATHLASTSLDTHVYVYSLEAPFSRYVHVAGAAPMGGAIVSWLPEGSGDGKKKGRVVSGGADGCVRVWEVVLP